MGIAPELEAALAYQQAGDYAAAIDAYLALLGRGLHEGGVYANLAEALRLAGRDTDAMHAYQAAARADPTSPEIQNNLSALLHRLERFEGAEAAARKALRFRPDYAVARYNLGRALEAQLRFPEAVVEFEHAVRLAPELQQAHMYLAFALLTLGETERGWGEWEWTRRHPDVRAQFAYLDDAPRWDGGAFAGKALVVTREGGHGDFIMMARFLGAVKRLGGTVYVECAPEMSDLAGTCRGLDVVVETTGIPPYPGGDYYVPMMDLPRVLAMAPETLAGEPYVRVPGGHAARWREALSEEPRLRVGIAWAGSASHFNDRTRSCGLAAFAPLAALDDVAWYSLQVGPRADEPAPEGLALARPALRSFGETAGLIENLDLVIAVDTSVAHLAGALGSRVWTLLPYVPEWRWGLHRAETPWYPSMRLFRQPRRHDWGAVFAQVGAALSAGISGELRQRRG